MTKELKEIKKKDRFLKEKIIFSLIFTTRLNKKLKQLDKVMRETEEVLKEKERIYNERIKKAHNKINKTYNDTVLLFFKRLFGMQKEKALMFNDNGVLETSITILPTKNEFKYKDNHYVVKRKDVSRISIKRILETEIFYFYNINTLEPLNIKKPISHSLISPKELHAIMESRQLINLNRASSIFGGLLEGNMKWVLIAGAGLLAFFLFGGVGVN